MLRKFVALLLPALLVSVLFAGAAFASPARAFADGGASLRSGTVVPIADVTTLDMQGPSAPLLTQAYKAVRGYGSSNAVTVGKATFWSSYPSNSSSTIYMTKNGRTTTLASGASVSFVVNGSRLYYAKRLYKTSSYEAKYTIRELNIGTGKERDLVTGIELEPRQCNGKYLYYGRSVTAVGTTLYALNLKTLSKRYMAKEVGRIIVKGGRVVTLGNIGSITNVPIYSFKKNGKGKKKIATGVDVVVKGKKVYYTKYKFTKNYQLRYKTYRCSLTGKNKKAVTGWRSSIPKKYSGR